MYHKRSRRTMQKKKNKKRILFFSIGTVVLVLGVICILIFSSNSLEKSLIKLPFKSTDTYLVHNKGIVYVQDNTIICLDEKAEEQSKFEMTISDIRLSVEKTILFAHGSRFFQVIDLDTFQSLFYKTVPGIIMDVSAGKECVAILQKEETGEIKLNVYDNAGQEISQLEFTYALLDFGFLEDDALWTLEVDSSGMMPVSKVSIYKDVGKSINGIVTIEDQIIQKVLFSTQEIFLFGTNHVIYCNYLGENRTAELVYGWYLQDYCMDRGEPLMLFSPRQEALESSYVSATRIVTRPGSTVTLQLVPGSIKVLPGNNKVFVFTKDMMYEYNVKGTLVQKRELPMEVTDIERAFNNKALLISDTEVYMVSLT